MIIFILLIMVVSINAKASLFRHQVTHNPGIHFEELQNVRIISKYWRLVTFIDIDKLEGQLPPYDENLHADLFYQCDIHLGSVCAAHLQDPILKYKYEQVKRAFDHIRDAVIGEEIEFEPTIGRRSASFGFIGSISKSLFGTLNDEDAEYFTRTIDEMYKDQKKISNIVKNQTHIVQSVIHKIHQELENTQYHVNMSEFLAREAIQSVRNLSNVVSNNELLSRLILWVNRVEWQLNEFSTHLEAISNALYLARSGILHPILLNTTMLVEAAKKYAEQGASDQFPLSTRDIIKGKLTKISHISIGYKNGKILIVMTVPLLNSERYQLYRLHPVPIRQSFENNTEGAAYIQPQTEYLLLSKDGTKYTMFSSTDAPYCQVVDLTKLCAITHLIYDYASRPNCEASILLAPTQPVNYNQCDIRINKEYQPYWKHLENNGWLYSLPQPERLTIICNDQQSLEKEIPAGTGIIYIQPGCFGKTYYARLSSSQPIDMNSFFLTMTKPILNISSLIPNITTHPKFTPKLEIPSSIKEREPYAPGPLPFDATLNELQDELEEIGTHHREKRYYQTILYSGLLGEIIIVALIFMYCCAKPTYRLLTEPCLAKTPPTIKAEEINTFFHRERVHPLPVPDDDEENNDEELESIDSYNPSLPNTPVPLRRSAPT